MGAKAGQARAEGCSYGAHFPDATRRLPPGKDDQLPQHPALQQSLHLRAALRLCSIRCVDTGNKIHPAEKALLQCHCFLQTAQLVQQNHLRCQRAQRHLDGVGTSPGFSPDAPKEGFSFLPMWVADMNFPTVPTIPEAIIERAKHPAFGYFQATDEYYDSIIQWQATRNGVTGLTREAIGYENGVLGGVISALNCVCTRGDKILIHSPTYIGFTRSLKNNGYEAVHSPLVKDENGVWRMDFEDMEKHLKEEKIHAAIMCNPHNPCGRVWERWELEKAMELYKKYDVYVVSDEIWSDIILSGNKHIPTQSVSEDARQRTAAFYAPSKTFNLAGLVGSYHIVYNSWWRDRMEKESSLSHYNMMNVLSMHALIGAYKPEGYEWTDELCEVLTGNIDFACDYIEKHFEGVTVSKPQGTYMLFVDCTDWCKAHGKTIEDVEHACWDVGAAIQDGTMFFGPCHLRMNLASPRSRIEEAFHRMDKYVFNA